MYAVENQEIANTYRYLKNIKTSQVQEPLNKFLDNLSKRYYDELAIFLDRI